MTSLKPGARLTKPARKLSEGERIHPACSYTRRVCTGTLPRPCSVFMAQSTHEALRILFLLLIFVIMLLTALEATRFITWGRYRQYLIFSRLERCLMMPSSKLELCKGPGTVHGQKPRWQRRVRPSPLPRLA